jgi:hypothetical protein
VLRVGVLVSIVALAMISCGDESASDGGVRSDAAGDVVPGDSSWPNPSDAGSDAPADSDAAALPPPGNALLLDDGSVVPLYPVVDSTATTRAVGFVRDESMVQAIDEHGAPLWQADLGQGALFGGFDFDDDGWPDLGMVRSKPSGEICGTEPVLLTSIDVARGKNGESFALEPALKSL